MGLINPAPVQNPMTSNLDVGSSTIIGFDVGEDLEDDGGNKVLGFPGAGVMRVSDTYNMPSSDGAALQYMRTNGAGVITMRRGEPLIIPLFDPSAGTNYIETASVAYVNIAQFNYMGSNSIGTISSMSAGIWTNDGAIAASIKIIDETNTNDIDEITGITSTSTTNQAGFPSILNVPAGSAVFSVNILTANATRRARVSWLRLSFS